MIHVSNIWECWTDPVIYCKNKHVVNILSIFALKQIFHLNVSLDHVSDIDLYTKVCYDIIKLV
jgi:hypothetical protein